MSFDERLRSQLDAELRMPELDVEAGVSDAIAQGRRRRRAAGMIGVVASLIVVLLATGLLVRAVVSERDRFAPAEPDRSVAVPFAGTYESTVSAQDPEAQMLSLTGSYSLGVSKDGIVDVAGPPDFERRWTSPAGPLEVDGDRMVLFVFQTHCLDEPGTYTWTKTSDGVRFEAVADECRFRRALFEREWIQR